MSVRIYTGLGDDGDTVSIVTGDIDELVAKSVEKYTCFPVGNPNDGTVVTPVAEISGLVLSPSDDFEKVFKYENALEVDEGAEQINDIICSRGLPIIKESAEEYIFKADEEDGETEERTVFAPVLEPNDGENGAPLDPDKQDEIYSEEAIRKTAHYWMEHGGVIGLMHRLNISPHISILETYLAPVSFVFESDGKKYKVRKGTWLLRVRVNSDELWKSIKDGEYGAFSVGGSAIKRKEEISKDGR